ncbi:MAG: hypothetical protein H6686_03535 [Fibrobacteria bacterium]|nr:hypothetical protein [Fibrobacteria bacterium]
MTRLATLALALAPFAHADRNLGTFDTPAPDSVAVRQMYGAIATSNPSSSRALSVDSGALKLTATLGMETDSYSARAGVTVPLNILWTPIDIRRVGAVSFDIWGSSTFKVNVSLGSEIYSYGEQGVVKVTNVPVTTTKRRVTIVLSPVCELEYLDWMDDPDKYPGGIDFVYSTDPSDPDYSNTERNVAMSVQSVQFAIDPTWGVGGKSVTAPSGPTTLSIDNIVLEGGNVIEESGCFAYWGLPSVVFSPMTGEFFDRNRSGGFWYTFTDAAASGNVRGSSKINLGTAQQWHMDTTMGTVVLDADLDRRVGGVYHPYAGFAGVGTSTPENTVLDLTGLRAIGFPMMIPDTLTLDLRKVEGVLFQVQELSVGDSVTHEVLIPAWQVARGDELCVDIDLLKMPDWFSTFEDGTPRPDYKPFSPHDVVKFNWMLKLKDGDTTAISQGFALGPITFYGLDSLPAPKSFDPNSVHRGLGPSSFTASYDKGLLSVGGLEGYTSVEVLSVRGARVTSFQVGSASKIRLDRGAYLLVARGEGRQTMSRKLAVAK